MIPWKDRLYAFLLSRVLGPWLDDDSLHQLHQTIEVSLQQGTLVLKDIHLNTQHITQQLLSKHPLLQEWTIRQATVQRLSISLSLQQQQQHESDPGTTFPEQQQESEAAHTSTLTSLAWQAVGLSSGDGGGTTKLSLLARVVIEGVVIHVEPRTDNDTDVDDDDNTMDGEAALKEEDSPTQGPSSQAMEEHGHNNEPTSTFTSTAKNLLSSYLEAALAALRLSVDLQNLTIRLQTHCSNPHPQEDPTSDMYSSNHQPYLEMHVASISYHDADKPASSTAMERQANVQHASAVGGHAGSAVSSKLLQPSQSSSYATVMHKTCTLTRISLALVSSAGATTTTTTLVLLEGQTQLGMRVIEYQANNNNKKNNSQPSVADSSSLQQDIQVFLGHKLNIYVDTESLQCLSNILEYLPQNHSAPTNRMKHAKSPIVEEKGNDPFVSASSSNLAQSSVRFANESEDHKAIESIILEQYNEARRHAERREVRGGLLIPDTSTQQEGDVLTFDAFFDANDQSFYRYSTLLSKSQAAAQNQQNQNDMIHTKLQCHLHAASAKVAYYQQDYILATVSEAQWSSTLSSTQSCHTLSVSHLEIEEGRQDAFQPTRTVISSILAFPLLETNVEDTQDGGDNDDEGILLHAPCISVSAIRSCPEPQADELKVDIDVEPFVLKFPPLIVHRISSFVSQGLGSVKGQKEHVSTMEPTAEHHTKSKPRLRLTASCPHLDIVMPVDHVSPTAWSSFFARPGVYSVDRHSFLSQSAMGVRIERLRVQTHDTVEDPSGGDGLTLSFQHILGYAYLHSDTAGGHRLFDIIALTGNRTTGRLKLSSHDPLENGINVAQVVPQAPPISSFKARQEDDDDDDFRIASRSELRGPDPQPKMMEAVSLAQMSLELSIPHVTVDLSVDEIGTLVEILQSLPSAGKRPNDNKDDVSSSHSTMSISVAFEKVSIALHEKPYESNNTPEYSLTHSYLLKLGGVRANVLLQGGLPQHVRTLLHDVGFHDVQGLLDRLEPTFYNRLTSEDRADSVRRRLSITSKTKIIPLLHRSYIFTPISHESPAFLLDLVGMSGVSDAVSPSSVYMTIYDLTYRFDYDSKSLQGFLNMLTILRERVIGTITSEGAEEEKVLDSKRASMTKVFICLADVNVDYTTPRRWPTPARAFLRFGEIRLSCNLITPSPSLQAAKLSVGDFSTCLCNTRYPYSFENSKLIDAEEQMEDIPLTVSLSAEEIQRQMNFRRILMLDCLDGIFTVNSSSRRKTSLPRFHMALTVGEVNLLACKDSFAVLLDSIGELSAEACAIDDSTLEGLMKGNESEETYYDPLPHDQADPSSRGAFSTTNDDSGNKPSRIPCVETVSSQESEASFLLDGYDWTTIHQDESVHSGIPPGDEQAARWYGTENTNDGRGTGPPEARIFRTGSDVIDSPTKQPANAFRLIHHHFPLQPTSDPLADGDMDAGKYAGGSTPPAVQNRVTVSDLSLKIRLFDGYDYPESLPETLRDAPRKGSFLIDLDHLKEEQAKSEREKQPVSTSDRQTKSAERKANLMAGLLAGQKPAATFSDLPLPEEQGSSLKEQAELRRLSRRTDKYVQFSVSGVQLRTDSFESSDAHRLVSCLDLKAKDFFLAETVSGNKPIKMVGEWFNDTLHPRNSADGLFAMKVRSDRRIVLVPLPCTHFCFHAESRWLLGVQIPG